MKDLIFLISLLILLIPARISGIAETHSDNTNTGDSLSIWCSPDLYELADTWISRYSSHNQEIHVKLHIVQSGMIENTVTRSRNIGLITKAYLPESLERSTWKMSLGRDVMVTVVNADNPFLNEIYTSGISAEKFREAFTGEAYPTWGSLLGDPNVTYPVSFYFLGDGNIQACLNGFMDSYQITGNVREISDRDEMLEKIRSDKYAMGFCRLANVLDYENQLINENLKLVPIDVNGNSRIDYFENIYTEVSDFTRGVWIGKYPKDFCSNIYSISGSQPTRGIDLAFLEWVLTDGQADLHSRGFSELLSHESYRNIQSLYPAEFPMVEGNNAPRRAITVLLILAIGLFGGGSVALMITGQRRKRIKMTGTGSTEIITALAEDSVLAPAGLFYDKTHTWALMEKDGSVRIGLDDFLLHVTGRITKIKMKEKYEKVEKGKSFISIIQDGKKLDINAPLSGTVTACNEKLENHSFLLNQSPYSDGWVYTVKPDNWIRDIEGYLMAEKYREWLKDEFLRLKNFLLSTLQPDLLNTSRIVLQDGGELRDNLLENLGPVEWEEFQEGFIDVSK